MQGRDPVLVLGSDVSLVQEELLEEGKKRCMCMYVGECLYVCCV